MQQKKKTNSLAFRQVSQTARHEYDTSYDSVMIPNAT